MSTEAQKYPPFFTKFCCLFVCFFHPSGETVLALFLCHLLLKPQRSIERQSADGAAMSSLLLASRISLVPLNNEVECVPTVLIKTPGHSSV